MRKDKDDRLCLILRWECKWFIRLLSKQLANTLGINKLALERIPSPSVFHSFFREFRAVLLIVFKAFHRLDALKILYLIKPGVGIQWLLLIFIFYVYINVKFNI